MHDPKNITAARLLLRYALPYRAALAFSLVCVLGAVLFRAAGPSVLERVADDLTLETTRATLAGYSLLLIGIAVVQGVATFGQELLLMRSAACIEHDLRSALFDHVQKMPQEFFQKHSIGELMMRVGNDLTAAINLAAQALSSVLDSLVTLIIILPLMIRVSAGLAAMAFAPLLLVIISSIVLQKKLRARFERVQEYMGKVYGQAHAALSVPRTIRAFTQERQEIEVFRRASRQYIDHYLSRVRLSSLLYPLLQFLLGLSLVVVVAGRRPGCGRKTLHRTVIAIHPLCGLYSLANARPGLAMDGLPERNGVHGQSACPFIATAGHSQFFNACRFAQAGRRSAIPERKFSLQRHAPPSTGQNQLPGGTGSDCRGGGNGGGRQVNPHEHDSQAAGTLFRRGLDRRMPARANPSGSIAVQHRLCSAGDIPVQ